MSNRVRKTRKTRKTLLQAAAALNTVNVAAIAATQAARAVPLDPPASLLIVCCLNQTQSYIPLLNHYVVAGLTTLQNGTPSACKPGPVLTKGWGP